MSVDFRPLGDRLLVRLDDSMSCTGSGIYIPEACREQPQEGVVVRLGTGKADAPFTVFEGDRVLVPKHGGTEIQIARVSFIVIREKELLCILKTK